jgi:hypothetical protein
MVTWGGRAVFIVTGKRSEGTGDAWRADGRGGGGSAANVLLRKVDMRNESSLSLPSPI